MKRIKTAGLCLVAVFAVSLLAVGSASALEYKTCIKASSGGEFSNKECTSPAPGGKYKLGAWNQGKKHTFKSKSASPHNYLVNPTEPTNTELDPFKAPKGKVGEFTASGSKNAGELTGPSTSTFTESFKKVKSGVKNCNSAGQGKGKIVTNLLTTTLVPLGAGSKQGEIVTAAKEPGKGNLAEYECEGITISDNGGVVVELVGLSGGATKTFHAIVSSREGNPNNLQAYTHAGGTASAAEEEASGDAIEVGACVKLAKKTPTECFVTYAAGDPEAELDTTSGHEPVTLVATVLGEPEGPIQLPAAQNATAETKGEAVKVQ